MNREQALPFARLGTLALLAGLAVVGPAHAQLVILDTPPVAAEPAPEHVRQVPPARQASAADAHVVTARTGSSAQAASAGPHTGQAEPGKAVSSPVRSPASLAPSVRQVGQATTPATKAEGWAHGVPLSLAVVQIVPTDWTVVYAGSAAEQERTKSSTVSWTGGADWVGVLDRALRRADAGQPYVTVEWTERRVWVGTPGQAAPTPPAPVKVWSLIPSLSLRENVQQWAKQAGWNQVVWEAVDYPVVAKVEFRGEFDSPDGPLAEVIRAYERSDQPLQVRLKTLDRVVHVVNKNYRPVQVEPSSPYELVPEAFPDSPRPEAKVPPLATHQG